LRLSYAGSAADVVEGMKRIRWALDPATAKDIQIGDKTVTRDWL
jgi:aspartate aminotransferase